MDDEDHLLDTKAMLRELTARYIRINHMVRKLMVEYYGIDKKDIADISICAWPSEETIENGGTSCMTITITTPTMPSKSFSATAMIS